MKGTRASAVIILNYIALPVIFFAGWHILSSSGAFPAISMPTLDRIANAFVESVASGMLLNDFLSSISIVVRGFFAGAVLGLILGGLMGFFAPVNRFFSILLNGFRQIPPLAWIPLLILWFGIGDTSKSILIGFGAFYPMLLNVISAIHETPDAYLEFAKNYKVKKKDIFLKILLPSSLPSIFVGFRLGASTAWMSIVAAEMIAATQGVGYQINNARNMLRTDRVICYMIVIGIIGGLMDYGIRKIARRCTKWQETKKTA